MRNFILLLFVITLACNTKLDTEEETEEPGAKIESPGVAVQTEKIVAQDFQKQIIANGKIEAKQKSELRFKTSERIASIKVRNGQKVSQGQVLAVLDTKMVANQLEKAKINLDKANSKLQEERINYGVEDAQLTPEVLKNLQIKSGYFEAKNELENAKLLQGQGALIAPFSGVVANIEAKQGNYITSGDVFCTLISNRSLEVVFTVMENELFYIKNSQKIELTSFAKPDKTYTGAVTEINPLVDENGLIKIRAKINNADNSLFDGMHVKVKINHPMTDVVVVPKNALVLRSNREVVFTVVEGLAKWNYVEVLDENSTSFALKDGVQNGDIVIVSGNMNLSHDAKVNIKNPTDE